MPKFMVPVNCYEDAVDALGRAELKTGPPLPRSGYGGNISMSRSGNGGSMSVSYPVFVDAENERAARRQVTNVLPPDGYEVEEPQSLRTRMHGAPVPKKDQHGPLWPGSA